MPDADGGATIDSGGGALDAGAPADGASADDAEPSREDSGAGTDAGTDGGGRVSPDAGPLTPLRCGIRTSPHAVFGACSGACEPALVASGSGWIAAFNGQAQWMDADGEPVGAPVELASSGAAPDPDVALADAGGGEVWALWRERTSAAPSRGLVELARFTSTGARAGAREVSSGFASPVAAAIAPGGGLGLVWSEGFASGEEGVYVQATDASGAPLGTTDARLGSIPTAGLRGDALAGASEHVACVALETGLWWHRVALDGGLAAHDFLALTGAPGESPRCSITARSATAPIVGTWSGDAASYFYASDGATPPHLTVRPITTDRLRLSDAATADVASAAAEIGPAAIGVAYRWERATGGTAVGFALLDASGGLVAPGIEIEDVGSYRARPVVAVGDDGSFGVAWAAGVASRELRFARVACEELRP